MNRICQVIATGQWCGPMLSDEKFPDGGAAWCDAVAETLDLKPGDLRCVDFEDGDDPRPTDETKWLSDPNVTVKLAPAPKTPSGPTREDVLLEEIEAATTIAGLKAAFVKWLVE